MTEKVSLLWQNVAATLGMSTDDGTSAAGGLEFGETVDQTIRKEIQEEYCTDVLDYEFLGYRDVHRVHDGKPTHWIALDFKVRVDREKVSNGEPHKFDEIAWFRLDKLPENVHSQLLNFIRLYRAKLEVF